MNTMSSTSITSTKGVTLISLTMPIWRSERRPRLLLETFPPPTAAPNGQTLSSSWREMMAENSSAKFSNRAPMRVMSEENLL